MDIDIDVDVDIDVDRDVDVDTDIDTDIDIAVSISGGPYCGCPGNLSSSMWGPYWDLGPPPFGAL